MAGSLNSLTDEQKARRLEQLLEWMVQRYLMAARSGDRDKERSHAGTLFFIETGKFAFSEDEGFYAFAYNLRDKVVG